jgi:thioredoxin reductase (NADPH)
VTPSFETNVPGLFIAGELGGMGLIRKAAEQGRQAMDSMRRRPRLHFEHDVVIVGCGPAGLSAGLSAIRHGLRYRLIEQEHSLGGAVFHYPRHKIAMTAAGQARPGGRGEVGRGQQGAAAGVLAAGGATSPD